MSEKQPGSEKQPETRPPAPPDTELSLLDRIIGETDIVRDESQRDAARAMLTEFARQILDEGLLVGDNVVASLLDWLAQIDELLSDQMTAVLHHPDMKKLEASWRGLYYLVSRAQTGANLRIRVLNVSKAELTRDLERAMEFDQSELFKKVYEEEYGTFGGNPYSCLMGDYSWGRGMQDIATLEKISNVAAAAHAPFLSAASPKMFDLASFTEMNAPRDLGKTFESTDLAKWRSFRASDDSRYVTLVLPHILMRAPYGPDTVPVEEFRFEERVGGKDHGKYLWGNAAYALAGRILHAFSTYGWTAAIRGVEGGGIVEDLPMYAFKSSEGDLVQKCPTEIAIPDRREKELSDLGFVALCHCKGTDYAVFFSGQTTHRAKTYESAQATSNARISAVLPYVMAASRFAHYLKAMMRDRVGSFAGKDEIQRSLNAWLAKYILLMDDAQPAMKARFPLREGKVTVSEVPGRPGAYNAVVFLRPHFQLDELSASIRLVAELQSAAA
jgi:type VI secretion system protein ImpC